MPTTYYIINCKSCKLLSEIRKKKQYSSKSQSCTWNKQIPPSPNENDAYAKNKTEKDDGKITKTGKESEMRWRDDHSLVLREINKFCFDQMKMTYKRKIKGRRTVEKLERLVRKVKFDGETKAGPSMARPMAGGRDQTSAKVNGGHKYWRWHGRCVCGSVQ